MMTLFTCTPSFLLLEWFAISYANARSKPLFPDAIKENLVPTELTSAQVAYIYANEADILGVLIQSDEHQSEMAGAFFMQKWRKLWKFIKRFGSKDRPNDRTSGIPRR